MHRIMTFLDAYTLLHVVISLIGIATGFALIAALLARKDGERWTPTFLATTVATSVTGYGFPVDHLLPSHIVGAISLVVLAIAIYARSARHLAGGWRTAFVIGAVTAQYFNVFVLVVQLFRRVPALNHLAPTQSEPPFAVAQLLVLVLFVVLGALAVKRAQEISSPVRSAKRTVRA
jgi:hypothetical protein